MLRHKAAQTIGLALAATAGIATALLVTAQPAQAMTILDLQADGFSIQADLANPNCPTYQGAVPHQAWTPIGNACDTNIDTEITNWYVANIGALRTYQKTKTTTGATVTITVTTTTYGAASTETITTTTTTPGPTTTETVDHYLTVPGPVETVTALLPVPVPVTVTEERTVTQVIQQPPVTETVTTTQIETQTQTLTHEETTIRTVTVGKKEKRRTKRMPKVRARRTG